MNQYYRANELAKKLSISPSTLWRWVANKRLPAPHRPSKRTSLFSVVEVEKAIAKWQVNTEA